jgi:hypothetical protein
LQSSKWSDGEKRRDKNQTLQKNQKFIEDLVGNKENQ